jgi:hypothetical protein
VGGLLGLEEDLEDLEECLQPFIEPFSNNDRFCDDCDPTFSFERIRDAILKFDRGRALRQRLLECRNRRLNETHNPDSRRECGNLEQVFELYVNDENSLEARRKGGAQPVDVNNGNPAPDAPVVAFEASSPQRLGRGLSARCGPPRGGPCQVAIISRGALIASGQRVVPAGSRAAVPLRATRRGQRLVRRMGRVRARVIVRTAGAFSLRRVTIKP